jgi:hypothetical protein
MEDAGWSPAYAVRRTPSEPVGIEPLDGAALRAAYERREVDKFWSTRLCNAMPPAVLDTGGLVPDAPVFIERPTSKWNQTPSGRSYGTCYSGKLCQRFIAGVAIGGVLAPTQDTLLLAQTRVDFSHRLCQSFLLRRHIVCRQWQEAFPIICCCPQQVLVQPSPGGEMVLATLDLAQSTAYGLHPERLRTPTREYRGTDSRNIRVRALQLSRDAHSGAYMLPRRIRGIRLPSSLGGLPHLQVGSI